MNAAEITRVLRSLRWRMVLRDFLGSTVRATLFFQGVLLVLTTAAWWLGEFRPNPADIPFVLGWPVAFGAVAGLVLALLRRPSLERVAQTVDFLGATRDRLLTGLVFSRKTNRTEMESMAVAEAERHVRGRDFALLLPVRLPRELPWLVAPLIMLGLLWWDAMQAAVARDSRAAEQTAEIDHTARRLDGLAMQLETKADATNTAMLRRIAERLRQSAEQMRAEAAAGGDARKTALRELALLEQLAKELRKPGAATPDELKALAEALTKHEQTREAAKDMQDGNLAGAAKKLQDAAAKDDAPSDAQVRQSIQQAMDHLARQKEQLSRQMEKLRNEAQAGAGGRREMLRQIADLLNDLQQQGKTAARQDGKGAGKPMTDEDLKKLLGALEDLKSQQQGGPGAGETLEGDGNQSGQISMVDFGKGNTPGPDSDEGVNLPSGQPGTEKDRATTGQPLGKPGAGVNGGGKQDQLSGKLAEGESLSASIPGAAGGDEKAARRYKELYEAAAADAEDAVIQENIPLGSRFLIKRYFEAIRPKQ